MRSPPQRQRGGSDGQRRHRVGDDLEAKPERVIDKVVVGDAPEGFVISPTGKLAWPCCCAGSNNAKTEFFTTATAASRC